MKRIKLFICLLIVMILAGCSHVLKKPPLSLDQITLADIRYYLELNNLRYQSLKATAQISVESPSMNFAAMSNIVIKKPDSILVRIKAPLGFGVGSIFMDRNQFLIYNSFENSVYTGDPGKIPLNRFLPFQTNLENLIQAFSGAPRLDYYEQDSLAIDRNQYLVIGTNNNQTMKYWIDPRKFVITEFQLLNAEHKSIITIEYQQFEKKDELFLPRLIQISQPANKTRITILYNTRKLNIPLSEKDFVIRIPDQAEWIRF